MWRQAPFRLADDLTTMDCFAALAMTDQARYKMLYQSRHVIPAFAGMTYVTITPPPV